MGTISRLFRPLDYIRIKHPAKIKYDFHIPFVIAVLISVGFSLLPKPIKIVGSGGLIGIITGLLQILTGFYIASLAAIATFNKEGMDDTMPGDPPTLKIEFRGKIKIDKLTRRRFLCLMFGYLSLMSICLYFIGEASYLLSDNAKIIFPGNIFQVIKWIFLFLYIFLASNLIITTLLGLFYMVDRIHRNEPRLIENDASNPE